MPGDLRLFQDLAEQRRGDDDALARLGEAALARRRHFDQRVVEIGAVGDGAVARHGPGRRRPDHDRRPGQRRVGCLDDREADMDRRRGDVLILDLGLGERGLLDDRPQHRLGAAVEAAVQQKGADLARDLGFRRIGHGGVGIVPIAQHAEPLELLALDVDPVVGELAAFLAELDDRNGVLVLARLAVLFLDLPLDRQAVAVPARDVVRVLAHHLLGAVDHVLEDLVQRVADMQMAVRIGRAVMQDEFRPSLRIRPQPLPQADLRPPRQQLGLALRQPGFHGKVGAGKLDRILVIGHRFVFR